MLISRLYVFWAGVGKGISESSTLVSICPFDVVVFLCPSAGYVARSPGQITCMLTGLVYPFWRDVEINALNTTPLYQRMFV